LSEFITERINATLTLLENEDYSDDKSEKITCEHFSVNSLDNLGLAAGSTAVGAVGATLCYLYRTHLSTVSAVSKIKFYSQSRYMHLDISAVNNLELFQTMRGKSKRGSLLGVLDKTKTAMGKRHIRG
jgi:DNA mismatch repair protein MutS